MPRTDRASLLINAPPDWVYRALVDPDLIAQWLPPKGAHGVITAFDARPGGAFAITLTFGDGIGAEGKSGSNKDVVRGQFVDLQPGKQVSQRFEFESPEPRFAGVMTMTWTLEARGSGTVLTVSAVDVPDGISPQEHEAGMTSSLEKLAALALTERARTRFTR